MEIEIIKELNECTKDTSNHIFVGCGKIPQARKRLIKGKRRSVQIKIGKYRSIDSVFQSIEKCKTDLTYILINVRDSYPYYKTFFNAIIESLNQLILNIQIGFSQISNYDKYKEIINGIIDYVIYAVDIIKVGITEGSRMVVSAIQQSFEYGNAFKFCMSLAYGLVYTTIFKPAMGSIQVLKSVVLLGAYSITQGALSLLKFTFNKARSVVDVDGVSTIWTKFGDMIDRLSESSSVHGIMEDITAMSKSVSSGFSLMQQLIKSSPWIIYIVDLLYNVIIRTPLGLTSSLGTLIGYPLPLLVFGSLFVLMLLGTLWNMLAYISCIKTSCDVSEKTEYIDLINKICTEQCWDLGVSGLSSLIVPDELIDTLAMSFIMVPAVGAMVASYKGYKNIIKDWKFRGEVSQFAWTFSRIMAEGYGPQKSL